MLDNSRSKKALINTTSYILGMIFEIIISLIIPRLILSKFGSSNNGLTASIEQFLSYTSLLYLGLAGATRAVLYKPLSEGDKKSISGIMSATQIFMQKVTIITIGVLLAFSCIYPMFVREDFSWWYVASLTFIIGINTLFQYYFAMPCRIILAADQRNYILTIVDIFTLILSSLVSIFLIYVSSSIHIVKLGSVCVRAIGPVILYFYVKKKYDIDYSVKPNMTSLAHRWDAGAHSIANFVNKNTDIVVLTLFTNIREVSVYTVYYLVINGLNKIGVALSSGLEGAFGNIIAKKQTNSLKQNTSSYETIIFALAIILYTSCAILIVPFVKVYTTGITDVSYERPIFGYLVSLAGLFATIRIPYQTIVQAAGQYKETRNGALAEAIINITLSVILVLSYGLIGVTIGTVFAMLYRTIQYAYYAYTKIIMQRLWLFIKRLVVMVIDIALIFLVSKLVLAPSITTYITWIFYAIKVFTISLLITLSSSIFFWGRDIAVFIKMLKRAVGK